MLKLKGKRLYNSPAKTKNVLIFVERNTEQREQIKDKVGVCSVQRMIRLWLRFENSASVNIIHSKHNRQQEMGHNRRKPSQSNNNDKLAVQGIIKCYVL